LFHVNAVPGSKHIIPRVTLLRAYGELVSQHPEYQPRYLTLLNQLAATEPDNPVVLSALAQNSMSEGTAGDKEAAIRLLSRAVQLGSSSVNDFEDLGSLLAASGRTLEAITIVEEGMKLDPYDERLYKSLALLNISAHRYAQALEAMRRDLQLFPQDDFVRELIRKAEGAASAPSNAPTGRR
jgi:tetratricopeptide (TPR) repeat protein